MSIRWFRSWWARRGIPTLLALLILADVMAMGVYTLLRFTHWNLPLGTIGEYAQSLWLLAHGRWLATNTLLRTPIQGDAGEIIILALVPFYRLAGVPFLLVLGVAAVAFSAWPLVRILRRHELPLSLLALLLILYFTAPAVIGGEIYAFDPNMLAMAFGLWAIDAAEEKRWGWYWLLLALLIATKDEAALLALGLIPWLWLRVNRKVALGTLGLALGWLVFIEAVVNPHFRSPTATSNLASHFENIGGENGLFGIAHYLLAHPGTIVSAVVQERHYLWQTLGPTAFLALGSPLLFLPGGGILLTNALSDLGPNGLLMRNLDSEYSLLAMPFLYLALGLVWAALVKRSTKLRWPLTALFLAIGGYQVIHSDRPMLAANWRVAPTAAQARDLAWLKAHLSPTDAVVTDNRYGVYFVDRANIMVQWDSLHVFTAGLRPTDRIVAIFTPEAPWTDGPRDWALLGRLARLPESRVLLARDGVIALAGRAETLPTGGPFRFPAALLTAGPNLRSTGEGWLLPAGATGTVTSPDLALPPGVYTVSVPLGGSAGGTVQVFVGGQKVKEVSFSVTRRLQTTFSAGPGAVLRVRYRVQGIGDAPLQIGALRLWATT